MLGKFINDFLFILAIRSIAQPELLPIDSQGTLMINILIQSELKMKNHNSWKIDSWELWERPACKDIQLNSVTWNKL